MPRITPDRTLTVYYRMWGQDERHLPYTVKHGGREATFKHLAEVRGFAKANGYADKLRIVNDPTALSHVA